MRPIGVTLVALYQFLRSVTGLIFGFFIVFYVGPVNKFTKVAAKGNTIERHIGSLGHAAGLIIFGFVVLHLLAGYGVFQMEVWGRILTIFFAAIELAMFLLGAVPANPFFVSFAALNTLCVLYLIMPQGGRAFQTRSAQREV